MLLGIVCGLISLYFMRLMTWCENGFARLSDRPYVKLLLGGSLLSTLIFFFPALYGEGYDCLSIFINGRTEADWEQLLNQSLFAGHGNKMEKLREIIAQESIENVRIHSFLHGQDFQDALAVSDCALISLEKGATGLCVPSKTYSYMMQGIPLLAIMDECDIVRDIQSGAGLWVRNGESERLATAIRFLRDNPEKARDMRRKCRELYLQKYTTEICTGKYVSLFRELLHPETGEENGL